MQLDAIDTLALGGVVLLVGYAVRRAVPPLARFNVPGPVIGGLMASVTVLAARKWGLGEATFDDAFKEPLQNAFFTAIGLGASYALLRRGGALAAGLLALTAIGGVLQNIVGVATAKLMGQPALLGVIVGSVTLTGGPATGLAFAPEFEAAGISGADAIAVAAAMGGIIAAGALGAPLGTALIERRRRLDGGGERSIPPTTQELNEAAAPGSNEAPDGANRGLYVLIKSAALILVAMWIGSWVSAWLSAHGVRLPSYIGAMIVAAAIRNFDDARGWIGVSQRAVDELGNLALAFFLALALMTLDLAKLSAVAVPLATILAIQIAWMAAFCVWGAYRLLGRDYDAAIVTSGYFGFMIGTTAVAMANIDALVRRYGPSPRAFLVVPIVGTMLLDFFNALLIESSIHLLR